MIIACKHIFYIVFMFQTMAAIHGERLAMIPDYLEAKDKYGVKVLADLKGDLEAKDKYGRTPISWAAEEGQLEVVKVLAALKADLEAKDNDGRTPISWAADEGQWEVKAALADLQAKNKGIR